MCSSNIFLYVENLPTISPKTKNHVDNWFEIKNSYQCSIVKICGSFIISNVHLWRWRKGLTKDLNHKILMNGIISIHLFISDLYKDIHEVKGRRCNIRSGRSRVLRLTPATPVKSDSRHYVSCDPLRSDPP